MSVTPTMQSKRGHPTPYALHCGYVDRRIDSPDVTVDLWIEHGAIHVRRCDRTLCESDRARIDQFGARVWREWRTYPAGKLTQAYQRLSALARMQPGTVL